MTLVFRLFMAGMAHVLRGCLVLFHTHITEPSLQGRGAERENQNEKQQPHIEKYTKISIFTQSE